MKSPGAVDVRYDAAGNRLSVHTRGTLVRDVLQAISEAAAIAIEVRDAGLLDEPIAIEVDQAPPERVIGQLLADFNFAATYAPDAATAGAARDRLVSVVVMSRRSSVATATETLAAPSRADAIPRSASGAPSSDASDLVRRVIDNPLAAHEVAAFLASSTDPELRAATEDALVGILSERDFRLYAAAVDVLKELAPERAVVALSRWLGAGDPQIRVVAAASLGQLESDQSVDALTAALAGPDPVTRQAAASSLAQIRSTIATAALLDAYASADAGVRQSIALAIASHGDRAAQQALASVATRRPSPQPRLTSGAPWPSSNQQATE